GGFGPGQAGVDGGGGGAVGAQVGRHRTGHLRRGRSHTPGGLPERVGPALHGRAADGAAGGFGSGDLRGQVPARRELPVARSVGVVHAVGGQAQGQEPLLPVAAVEGRDVFPVPADARVEGGGQEGVTGGEVAED